MAPNTISYEFPDPADESSYEDDFVYGSGSEEEDEPADWTPNTCAYEVQEYGDDATMFVADKPMIVHVPNPVNFVDPDYWNMVQYRDHMEYIQTQADLESKRVEHTKFLAWRRNIRRGLPTESRLGKAKRILREQQETEQAAVMKANAKLAPKYGSSRKRGGGRKGRRGVVVVDAAVVKQRRVERRKVAKAAQVLRACPVAVATPVEIVAAPVFIAPEPLSEDPEVAAEQIKEEQEIEEAEKAEVDAACSTAKTWTPCVAAVVDRAPKQESWTTVTKIRRKPDGFVKSTATRGRKAKQLTLDLAPPPPKVTKNYTHNVNGVPAGWVFTHPCMDLRSHINDSTPLCKHFQFGTCNFGISCKFKHTYGACKFGANCRRRGTCKRAHPPTPPTRPPTPPTPRAPPAQSSAPPPPTPPPTPPTPPTPVVSSTLMPMAVLKQLSVERPRLVCDVIQKIVKSRPNWTQSPEPEFECVLMESGGFTLEPNAPPTPPAKTTAAEEHPIVRRLNTMIATDAQCKPVPQHTAPTRTCMFWKQGKQCKHGAKCRFAHFDIKPKTCKFWAMGVPCKHGAKCRFAHS